jgi:hypothetical protein
MGNALIFVQECQEVCRYISEPNKYPNSEMNIASTPAVQAASAAAPGAVADAINILVLKKALDVQASAALTLLQTLPDVPSLAASGSLGTRVNAFA